MDIPQSALRPFGYTGMPVLMRTDLDEVIDRELRELVSRANHFNASIQIVCTFLQAKAKDFGATSATAIYKPRMNIPKSMVETGSVGKVWTPSAHYVVDYVIAGQPFKSYIYTDS